LARRQDCPLVGASVFWPGWLGTDGPDDDTAPKEGDGEAS
jgi:hypothetical protein